ncbi:WD40-repeat-containing domain protein [Trichoderma evansii]
MDNIKKLPFGDDHHCLKIFGAMAKIYQPIKLTELRALVNLPPEIDIERLIKKQTVKIWDVESTNGLQLLSLQHADWVQSAVFSRDGKSVASGSDDKTVRVWDIHQILDGSNAEMADNSVECSHILRGFDHWIASIVFSEDGRYVAAGGVYGRVLYWDLTPQESANSPQPMKVLMQRRQGSEILSLVFNSDASSLIACSSDQIWIWDTASSQCVTAKCNVLLHTLRLNPAYPEYVVTVAGPILIKDIEESDELCITPTKWCPYSFTNFDKDSVGSITWQVSAAMRPELDGARSFLPVGVFAGVELDAEEVAGVGGCQADDRILVFGADGEFRAVGEADLVLFAVDDGIAHGVKDGCPLDDFLGRGELG